MGQDFGLGKIYRLYNKDTTDTYIGSTAHPYLSKRYWRHRDAFKKGKDYGEIFSTENHNLELIESYPCGSKKELLERERYWIELLQGCKIINKNLPICWNEEERQQRINDSKARYNSSARGKLKKKEQNLRYNLKKLHKKLALL